MEQRAVLKAANAVGSRSITLLPEPLLAALGAGLPIDKSAGSMIVNMGGGTSEVAVMSLDGIVEYESLRVAGDAINESIISFMRKKKGVLIGEQTAENIKIKIGSAVEVKDPKEMEVRGRDVGAGMPKSMVIDSNDVAKAIEKPLRDIIKAIQTVLEKLPQSFLRIL